MPYDLYAKIYLHHIQVHIYICVCVFVCVCVCKFHILAPVLYYVSPSNTKISRGRHVVDSTLNTFSVVLLGALSKLRKATICLCVCPYVPPHGTTRLLNPSRRMRGHVVHKNSPPTLPLTSFKIHQSLIILIFHVI
jgi:hypothetical protein